MGNITIQQIENLKTPCYIIDVEKFEENIKLFEKKFTYFMNGKKPLMGYSIKTNHTPNLLEIAKTNGMMAEAVSDDEYQLALECGYKADQIILNGPQKSEKQLIWALNQGSIVNLDNFEEISVIKKYIHDLDLDSLRVGLRVNFDLEKQCPGETTAGEEVSRFGFCVENGEFERAVSELNKIGIRINGIHMHYSSKSRSTGIFRELASMAASLIRKHFENREHFFVDMGGGFFLGKEENTPGKPTVEQYAAVIIEELQKSIALEQLDLIIEPGAALLATPITYLTKVINSRMVRNTKILTLDGSILHINPFMAKREPVAECIYCEERNHKVAEQIFCGATCMENDRFLKVREADEVEKGDFLYCYFAGAYTMGFNNCFINLPPYVYLQKEGKYELTRDKSCNFMKDI